MAILPLFPELELLDAHVDGGDVVVTLRNACAFTIRTRTYGEPEYRLIAKQFEGDVQVDDRWLALPRDVGPGETATIAFPHRRHATTLRLEHALQDVPLIEAEVFAEVRLVR
jgi:hypothetical protein